MEVDVTPEVTRVEEDGYIITLRGTAALGTAAIGWFKTKIVWWSSEPASGTDIMLDIPKAAREIASGTEFSAAIYWRERSPGNGEPLWWGRYRVRNTPGGPVLDAVE